VNGQKWHEETYKKGEEVEARKEARVLRLTTPRPDPRGVASPRLPTAPGGW